jgi:pilus assembly protein CpaB
VAVGIYRLLGSRSAQPEASVAVVLAKGSIQSGMQLDAESLRDATRPLASAPQDALSSIEAAAGRIARTQIDGGEVITETLLVPSTQSAVRSLLKAGFRAVGVFVDARGAIQQVLQAGDRVDVIVTLEDEENVSSSRVVLQDIEVLMAPAAASSEDLSYAGDRATEWIPITLAVKPAEAEKLSLAMRVGSIQLALRGYDDQARPATSGVTRDTLLPAVMAPEEATFSQVELIKGQERDRLRFLQGSVSRGDS